MNARLGLPPLLVTETPAGISAASLRYRHIPLWVRQGARLDARPAATGALESARLDACFLHQRVCVPLDAAVTPVTLLLLPPLGQGFRGVSG